MNKSITAIEPQRDQYGYWTHPGYFEPANGMEYGAPGEFEAWLDTNRVIGHLQWMESDVTDEQLEALEAGDGDISKWNPTPPDGDGWFIGSIHDTEDGPVCYWLRPIESDPIALKAHIQKCHIEALSQPVAFTDREELDSMRGPDADTYAALWIIPHGFGQDIPLYSQDCIDLLQSDLQVTRDALKSVTELWNDQRQLIAGFKQQLQQPIKLPEPCGWKSPSGHSVLIESEVIDAIRAAGGTALSKCQLCDRLLDLTHRPDGGHYCHHKTKVEED